MDRDNPPHGIKRVEIVVPVYNEATCLAGSIERLCDHLDSSATYEWLITIADNASTDATPSVAEQVVARHPAVRYLRIPQKGRGLALRQTFAATEADAVSYMDVDLSTNLRYFNLLIEGLRSGFDIAVGSRLLPASHVERNRKREVLSRGYNLLIRALFRNRFSDAQCGFKAVRAAVARELVPQIKDNNWFFDTELLLLAEHAGHRVFDVPVEWIEDLDSRVNITATILEDLAGLARMRRTLPLTAGRLSGKTA